DDSRHAGPPARGPLRGRLLPRLPAGAGRRGPPVRRRLPGRDREHRRRRPAPRRAGHRPAHPRPGRSRGSAVDGLARSAVRAVPRPVRRVPVGTPGPGAVRPADGRRLRRGARLRRPRGDRRPPRLQLHHRPGRHPLRGAGAAGPLGGGGPARGPAAL
ncbi:MAG: hypothetical protein AVDCRST_MAG07-2046, partial [uncultured Frankineae bacterium]